jgi:hypothetical protein
MLAVMTRHIDHGIYLRDFADEVLVRCVRCDVAGVVLTEAADRRRSARFCCSQCALTLDSTANDWAGPVCAAGRRPCGYCGHQWLVVRKSIARPANAAPQVIDVRCPTCGNASAVPVEYQRCGVSGAALDPYFGLPLLLCVSCRHGLLWAYNRRHLRELQAYVGAQLRERRGGGNSALFSRLPTWIKLARHRSEVLKALQKMALSH